MRHLLARFASRHTIALATLCGLALPLHAAEYCVGNVTDLNTILIIASAAQTTNVIKLQQGTYHIGGSFLSESYHHFNDLELLGGYNADCSVRALNPQNTILDGDGQNLMEFGVYGDLLIEGLRFQNFATAWATPNVEMSGAASVTLRNNILFNTGARLFAYDTDDSSATFSNNLVVGAPANLDGLQIDSYHGFAAAVVTNNTVVNSLGRGIALCDGSYTLSNNIVWNNATRDIWLGCDGGGNPQAATFRNNTYATRYGNEAVGSSGTLNSNPLFLSAGNFHLQNASPAINSGSLIAAGQSDVDLDGNARIVGSALDRGAYESAVDNTIPAIITVTNANDSGAGSLRQAILDANAGPGFNYINFNIPGACPVAIWPDTSNLPVITDGVRIDGYSQPGSRANSLSLGENGKRCILLRGFGTRSAAFIYNGPTSSQFWLQGVAFESFTGYALYIFGGNDNIVWGNQFGGKIGTYTLAANANNIYLGGVSTDNSIGGSSPAQRNVIAAASGAATDGYGVFVSGSANADIVGNLFGTYGIETSNYGNRENIYLATAGNSVKGNVLINSALDGVRINGSGASGNRIENNRIGLHDNVFCAFPPCSTVAPNARHGVRIESGAHDNVVFDNTIWNSAAMGVSVQGSGKGNRISANSIYNSAALGIDLEGSDGNDNDSDLTAANLPNRGLNFPSPLRAYGGRNKGWVDGRLYSINAGYSIQVFSSLQCDAIGNGEGQLFHRSGSTSISNATAGLDGLSDFRVAFTSAAGALSGRSITLTATDSVGNTSEFSDCAAYQCDVIFSHGYDDAIGDSCP